MASPAASRSRALSALSSWVVHSACPRPRCSRTRKPLGWWVGGGVLGGWVGGMEWGLVTGVRQAVVVDETSTGGSSEVGVSASIK